MLGDPQGTRFVEAPTSHADMTRLDLAAQRAHLNFYCAVKVGGCGERVYAINGTIRRPHFRHSPGSVCLLRDEEARDRFTHRIIQDRLVAWLTTLGHVARAEHYLDRKSRVDVHCQPHSVIEVQLSAETTASMIQRSDRYGPQVSWLFGTSTNLSSRDQLRHQQGAVLVVQAIRTPTEPGASILDRFAPGDVEVGISHEAYDDVKAGTVWAPLDACAFDPADGVLPPGYRGTIERIAAHRTRVADTLAEAQKRAAQAKQTSPPPHRRDPGSASRARHDGSTRTIERVVVDPVFMQRLARQQAIAAATSRAGELRTRAATADEGRPAGPRVTVLNVDGWGAWERHFGRTAPRSGPWSRALAGDPAQYVARTGQIDPRWVKGLPAHLVDAAWAALYYTMIVQSAPLTALCEPDLDPEAVVVGRLRALGLIAVVNQGDLEYYETAHDLRYVGTPVPWEQPPPWPGADVT